MLFFFFNDTATTEIYTLSLHDALPISCGGRSSAPGRRSAISSRETAAAGLSSTTRARSEEHTSELQSPCNLVCRLLLEKKKTNAPLIYNTASLRLKSPTNSPTSQISVL